MENPFVSIPPNLKTSYYEHNTYFNSSMVFEQNLIILHVEIIRMNEIQISLDRQHTRTIMKSMHIVFHAHTTPMTRSVGGKMSITSESIGGKTYMHH